MPVAEADTSVLEFDLPESVPIDAEHTLNQLTSRFRSLKDGVPELVKNSKDQYSRLGINDRESRQIVVIASTDKLALAVIDFAGAPAENFVGWTVWSDPNAGSSYLAADIEAGHGNGGKAFMVRGATSKAFLDSCFEGRRTSKGFVNDQPGQKYKPGFRVVGGTTLNDVPEPDPEARLAELLAQLGSTLEVLPAQARAALALRKSYTVAFVQRVVEWEGKRKGKLSQHIAQSLLDTVASHGQTAMTVATCVVWVIVDGVVIGDGPVEPFKVEPFAGFETPREFPIPNILPDPETGEPVNVLDGSTGPDYLRLQTSGRQLQMSSETRAKNVIRVWNHRNNVATWPLQALRSVSSASFIYGELRCQSLFGEHLSGADRIHLSDTPLVRALEKWVGERVEELANDLHRAMAEQTNPKERERARTALSSIRDLMRKFLDPDSTGAHVNAGSAGTATGSGGTGNKPERNKDQFGTRVDRIQLEGGRSDLAVITGTKIPLLFSAQELSETGDALPVKNFKAVLHCDPAGQFQLDEANLLHALQDGVGKIWLTTIDGQVASNRVEIWCGKATSVSLQPPSEPLKQGEKKQLSVTFVTDYGPLDDALVDARVVEPEMGMIGRHGRFTAGKNEGIATVRVKYAGGSNEFCDFTIHVGPDAVPPPEGQGDEGSDVPDILLCGDQAPNMAEFPPEQRTMSGGPEYPTIIEDPLFPNIVWINPNSKEALRVRKSRGGPSGVARVTSATFMQFVALKCFDILKRLYVRQKIAGRTITEYEYMQLAVEAEIECADFIDAAWGLSDEVLSKEALPNG
jgi:hypothetical protein